MRSRLRAARSSARRGGSAAFTLVELLVVLAIVAILFGIGLGLLAQVRVGDRAAVGIVENAIRGARNWSVARSGPALVRIDAKRNRIQAIGFTVVGTWQFEDESLKGALGHDGVNLGGEIVEHGFVGRALSFAAAPARSRAEFPVQVDPAFDVRHGFSIACALRVAAAESAAVLQLGESCGLDVTDHGAVRAWIAPELVDENGDHRRGGRIPLETREHVLQVGRWSQVEVQYDGRALRILVDGAPEASVAEDTRVWPVETPLVISPAANPFRGAIDQLVIAAALGDDERELPRGVSFAPGGPDAIAFEAGGALDREVHREPVRLALQFDDGRTEAITVNLHGTVE